MVGLGIATLRETTLRKAPPTMRASVFSQRKNSLTQGRGWRMSFHNGRSFEMRDVVLGLLLSACSASELVVTPETFGAVGDGKSNDWLSIQQALAACSTAVYNMSSPRPCRVRFSGKYLSGPLIINSSRTTLEVAVGATLAMLPKPDYETECPQTGCPFISTGEGPQGCSTVAESALSWKRI